MSKAPKTAVLLINLGTPKSPSVGHVRSYLRQFLNDPRVIDLPWLWRFLLVNLIIVPFRSYKSASIYQRLWTVEGSPISIWGDKLKRLVQVQLGSDFVVEIGMRYQQPSIASALQKLKSQNPDKLTVLPLFPQYASASNGSAIEEALKHIGTWWTIPELRVVGQFWNNVHYLKALKAVALNHRWQDYDHVLFSYHGLPERHVDKVYDNDLCANHSCETEVDNTNHLCYKATCYGTTRLLAGELGIPETHYTVCFQSRLNKRWLTPFSDEVIVDLAKKGMKRLLVFSPAFVADCLETTIEIGHEYQELFQKHGGEKVQLVESLNDHPAWVEAVCRLVTND